jgi:monoamine oxidase
MAAGDRSRISRRTFNKATLLGAAALAAPAVHTGRARAQDSADVIVIGGGLSGLNAAGILSDAGLSVIVLEGSGRIGGRVWTADETWQTNSGEVPIELGASQVGPSYARVRDVIERLEIPTVNEDRKVLPFASHIAGELIKAEDWPDAPQNKTVGAEREIQPVGFGSALISKFNPLEELDDWFNPRFADYDVSFYDLFKRNGVSAAGIQLAANSTDIYGVSALRLMQEGVRGKLEAEFAGPKDENGKPLEHWPKNIKGGTVVLPRTMAAHLPNEVRLNQQAAAIEQDADGVEVRCLDGNRYRARFVISSLPFSLLKDVFIWPRPPEPQLDAIENLTYSETTRAFCNIKAPFWEEDGFEPSLFSDGAVRMFWTIDNDGGNGTYRGMFVLTNKVGAQVAARPPEEVEQFLVDELARIRPSTRGQIEMLKFHSWERQPFQKGCSPMFSPGQVTAFANEMILPHGRLHFAGEHTRRLDYGMEAAMESGERAAFEVLDRA